MSDVSGVGGVGPEARPGTAGSAASAPAQSRRGVDAGAAGAAAAGRFEERLVDGFGYYVDGAEVLARRRSAYQDIEILRSPAFGAMLRLDGALQCSERDEFFYHEPIVHGALVRLTGPVRALVIGGGDGGAAEELLKWPNVVAVDHVEIDADVLALCAEHLPGVHRGVLAGADARYRAHVADGAAWVAALAPAGVEAIVLDLTDCGGPSSPLYAPAFYAACRRALAPGGVLTLHLAAPFLQLPTCVRLHAALARAFPSVEPLLVAVTVSGGQWLMAACHAGDGAALPPLSTCAERLATLRGPPLQLVSAETLHAMHALPPYLLAALAPGAHPVSRTAPPATVVPAEEGGAGAASASGLAADGDGHGDADADTDADAGARAGVYAAERSGAA